MINLCSCNRFLQIQHIVSHRSTVKPYLSTKDVHRYQEGISSTSRVVTSTPTAARRITASTTQGPHSVHLNFQLPRFAISFKSKRHFL